MIRGAGASSVQTIPCLAARRCFCFPRPSPQTATCRRSTTCSTSRSRAARKISPDGKWVAYTVTSTDFKQDAYVTHIWLASTQTGRSLQLTRGEKSAGNPQWSPDGEWLAFTSNRVGDKNQIFAHPPGRRRGGAAHQGRERRQRLRVVARRQAHRLHRQRRRQQSGRRTRKDYLGDFEVVRKEYDYAHLWTLDVAEALKAPVAGTPAHEGQGLQRRLVLLVARRLAHRLQRHGQSGFDPGRHVGHLPADVWPTSRSRSSCRSPAPTTTRASRPMASRSSSRRRWASRSSSTRNSRLAVVPADGGTPRSITDSFDENPELRRVERRRHLLQRRSQKTASHLFRVDPATGAITRISQPDDLMAGGVHASRSDGQQIAFTAAFADLAERSLRVRPAPLRAAQADRDDRPSKGWTLGTREVISWKSKDGTTIEGVLIKPADFDPTKKYPLLCVIHGGPTGVDRPALLDTRYYPADIWAGRGRADSESELSRQRRLRREVPAAQRAQPRRRRRVGRALGRRLPDRARAGSIPKHVGCMGWSQGGYISAFLTTSIRSLRGDLGRRRASPTGRPTTTTPTSRRSRSSTSATIRRRSGDLRRRPRR